MNLVPGDWAFTATLDDYQGTVDRGRLSALSGR